MSTVAERATARDRPVARRLWLRRSPVRRFVGRLGFWLLITVIFVYALFPFYWAVRSAFTPEGQLFDTPIKYFPSHPTLTNFREIFSTSFFTRALLNSTLVAGSVTLMALVIGSLAAYALGRFRFRGRSAVLYLMLSMTIFPQIAILGALYTMMRDFHLYDRLGSLILSYMIFTLPFTIWVLTSFMRALPGDLEEAAYVDGATPLQVFYKVLLPLIAPGLVATSVFAFITSWNEYIFARILLNDQSKQTVTVWLSYFLGTSRHTDWGALMAGSTLTAIPVVIFFVLVQRRIAFGLTAGSVKG